MVHANARLAAELEADALAHPDERGEILLEAAEAWRSAGDHDRAVTVLAGLIADGDERGCDARIQLADLHLEAGEREMGYAQLAAAAKDPALGERQCEIAAEMLAAHDDLAQAARWYDRAAARLTGQQLDAVRRADTLASIATTIMLRNRRDVRRQLGRSPDTLDDLAPDLAAPRETVTAEDVLDLMSSGVTPTRLRMLTFRRDQRPLAQERWPGEYPQSDDEYYAAAESRWRQVRDGGVRSIVLVPADVEALTAFADAVGGSATDSTVKKQFCQETPDSATIAWPPERNAACWCGSERKYKKCCGRP